MRLVRNIGLAVLGLVVVIGVIGLFLPRDVRVERQTVIEAPQATVFTLVNTLQSSPKWSPWLEFDPQTQINFEGPLSGVGSKMSWTSDNANVGNGSQEIVASEPDARVRTFLDFGDMGTAHAEFLLEPEDGKTRLKWVFEDRLGVNPFGRYMGLMMGNFIGPSYERGLENLKAYAESLPPADLSQLDVSLVETPALSLLTTRTSAANDAKAMGVALGYAYLSLTQVLEHKGAASVGAPMSISVGQEDGQAVFDAALPIANGFNTADLPAGIEVLDAPAGKALRAVHTGGYADLGATYTALLAYAMATGADISGASWNEYVGDPATSEEAELVTYIYLPVN